MRIVTPDRRPLVAGLLAAVICLLPPVPAIAGGGAFGPPRTLTHPEDLAPGETRGFGRVVAIARRTLVVGSTTRSAEGISRSELLIYERRRSDPAEWRLAKRLSTGVLGELGGARIALDGDRLAVATNVGGQGAVLLYERGDAGTWRRHQLLRPKLPGFPGSLALDGDRLAVGVWEPLFTVLVYERERRPRGRWRLTARLEGRLDSPTVADPSRFVGGDGFATGFGWAVGLSGDSLAVGALDPGPCCGKAPLFSSLFIFERDGGAPAGWRQLHNFAAPGFGSLAAEERHFRDAPFGRLVDLSGPFLLAGEGLEPDEPRSNRTRMHVYERDHHGPGRWGYRRELRRGRRTDSYFLADDSALRGNTAALVESAFGHPSEVAVRVFERDFPGRDRWGLLAHLPLDPALALYPRVALGHRELVVAAESGDRLLIYPRAPLVADRFEGGMLEGWTGPKGALAVVSPGLEGSEAALAVAVGGTVPSFLASNRPRREPLASLRFSLDPNAVRLGGQRLEILRLYAGVPALRLSLEESDADPMYRAVLEVRRPDGAWLRVGRARILPDRESVIGIEYRAATADGAADGAIRFEVNGHLIRRAERLDLDRMLVGRVVLGLPVGSRAVAGGSFLLDEFEMHR